ncbi:hypothetical protein ATZ99_11150 [Thermovenabulum gondwanense]|uniref:N-acetyltransferase domain-containing protein n=1 Tax=Thermovenabulum gondwanense TaxID=520767 RepID=A0A162MKG4_9FIRM|nr:hypothetical protein ATZ99_11150 [Thermovenabulum gondwanense]
MAPEYQGRGFGKINLKKCLKKLLIKGAEKIKLIVISSNRKAYKMYRENSFDKEELISAWYKREYKN